MQFAELPFAADEPRKIGRNIIGHARGPRSQLRIERAQCDGQILCESA